MRYTGKQLAEQYRTGDHFPGHGVFGSGTYTDSNAGRKNVAGLSYGKGRDAGVLRMALPKTAKIISVSELEKTTYINGFLDHPPNFKAYPQGRLAGECWLGVQAALAGYDAIYVDGAQRSTPGYGKGFYVVLNRSIMIVQREDARGHQIK